MSIKFLVNLFLICSFIGLSACGRGKTSSELDDSGTEVSVVGKEEEKLLAGTGENAKDTPSSISGGGNGEIPTAPASSDSATKPSTPEDTDQFSFKKLEIALLEFFDEDMPKKIPSGLLEGQSDAFSFYIKQWVAFIDFYIKNRQKEEISDPLFDRAIRVLCPDPSKCEKELNLEKVDKFKIVDMMRLFSVVPMNLLLKEGKNAVVFIQSSFSNSGDLEIRKSGVGPPYPSYMESVQGVIKWIIDSNVKDIIINFPITLPIEDPMDFLPFFHLGEVIKKQEIDLHIVGNCGTYCVNYLLPVAKTVYVEPFYGYVSTRGSFKALKDSVIRGREFPQFAEEWKNEFSEFMSSEEEGRDLMVKYFQKIVEIWSKYKSTIVDKDFPTMFSGTFDNEVYPEGTRELIVSKKEQFVSSRGKQSFVDLTEEELTSFVVSLPPKLSNNILTGIFRLREKNIEDYFNNLQRFASEESDYYDSIEIKSLKSKSYTFLDFLYISSLFVRQPAYEKYFFLPRPYYTISEERKPYWVAPSLNLLRELGLDVRGEKNNIDRLFNVIEENYRESKDRLLYIDSEGVKNCNLFNETASFDKGTLDQCL